MNLHRKLRNIAWRMKHFHRHWLAIIGLGGSGNIAGWCAGPAGMGYTAVPTATWHPFHKLAMRNDLNWPMHVWVIARK